MDEAGLRDEPEEGSTSLSFTVSLCVIVMDRKGVYVHVFQLYVVTCRNKAKRERIAYR